METVEHEKLALSCLDEKLAGYLLYRTNADALGLQKALWTTNCAFIKLYNQPVVSFEFKAYHHGPFYEPLNKEFSRLSQMQVDTTGEESLDTFIDMVVTMLKSQKIPFRDCYTFAHLTHMTSLWASREKNTALTFKAIETEFARDPYAWESEFLTGLQQLVDKEKEETIENQKKILDLFASCEDL